MSIHVRSRRRRPPGAQAGLPLRPEQIAEVAEAYALIAAAAGRA